MLCSWCGQPIRPDDKHSWLSPVPLDGEQPKRALQELNVMHRACVKRYEAHVLWEQRKRRTSCSNRRNEERSSCGSP